MNAATLLNSLALSAYGPAFAFYWVEFLRPSRNEHPSWGSRFFEIGFMVQTLGVLTHAFTDSRMLPAKFYLPVASLGEASGFFAWALAFVYLILVRRLKTEGFGLVLVPILILFLIPTFFPFPERTLSAQHFHNVYFLIHILSIFFGFASFTLSFISGILYWIQDRSLKLKVKGNFYSKLPSLEDMEHFIFKTILWGLLLLGAGILAGSLWSKNVFGSWVVREPKSFASLLTWGVYFLIVYLHKISMMKGKRLALLSLAAFLFVLVTFWGTSVYKSSFHVGVW